MAIDHVLISRAPGETRIALLSGGRLDELVVARTGLESVVGTIYLGRVEAALKGLDAAFVDIGLARAGFLALPEARPSGAHGDGDDGVAAHIGDFIGEGDAVLVQALRDPAEDKGAKLTTHINLAGVGLVFRPGHPGVSVSRRITDEGRRARLTALIEGLTLGNGAGEEGGFIVRTAAAEATDEAIEREARGLAAQWTRIRHKRANSRAPALLYAGPGPACRALRELGGAGIRKVIADDAKLLAEVRAYCEAELPDLAPRVEAHKSTDALFEAFGVEDQIDGALMPAADLAGGGSLIISQTPALTAIDVNTGGADSGSRERTAFDVNMSAAFEIARQIRLRNISGLIVVDFVPVKKADHRRRVLDALTDAVAGDPLGPHVVGYTRMGLVEMTRRRQGLSLQEIFAGPWPRRGGSAPVKSPLTRALEALRQVMGEARARATAGLSLRASPAVIEALGGPAAAALTEAEETLGLAIELITDQTLADGRWEVVAGNGG